MKRKSIINKLFIAFIIMTYIFSICGVLVSNADENDNPNVGVVSIKTKMNETLLFHDYNEDIAQDFYSGEDYAKIDYTPLTEELMQEFENEPHEEIYGVNNLDILDDDYEFTGFEDDTAEPPTEDGFTPLPYKIFDIKRMIDSKKVSTTYLDSGYFTVIKVDNNMARLVEADGNVNGVSCDINGEFVSNGNYIKVNYVVKNNNSNKCNISLATFSDIQIGVNDSATVTRQPDGSGIVMTDETSNLQFRFFGRNVEGATNIDNLWIGAFPYQMDNFFNNNNINEFAMYDSAFAYSWKDRTIASGETQVFSVLYGVDELSAIPVVTLDKGMERYTSEEAEVTGSVTDSNQNDTGKIYFNIDDGKQIYLGRYNLRNSKYDFEIDLSKMALEDGVYKVKVWAIDESGLISTVAEKSVVIGANTPAPKPVENIVDNKVYNNQVIPKTENKINNNTPQTSNKVTNSTIDNTMSSKTLPYTGFKEKVGVMLFFSLIIARVIYVKYKKVQF